MKLLLIEQNAFMAYDLQSRLNLLGIFSIRLCGSVDELLHCPDQPTSPFDVVLLRQGADLRQDLHHLWQLQNRLRLQRIVLSGCYRHAMQGVLHEAVTSLKLPLPGFLRLPVQQRQLAQVLSPMTMNHGLRYLSAH